MFSDFFVQVALVQTRLAGQASEAKERERSEVEGSAELKKEVDDKRRISEFSCALEAKGDFWHIYRWPEV